MIKLIHEYLKNANYNIIEDNLDIRVTAVDIKTKLVITHTVTGKTIIASGTDKDIRFNGQIENIQQLKMIIKLILA